MNALIPFTAEAYFKLSCLTRYKYDFHMPWPTNTCLSIALVTEETATGQVLLLTANRSNSPLALPPWPENSGHGPGFTVYDSVYSTPYI